MDAFADTAQVAAATDECSKRFFNARTAGPIKKWIEAELTRGTHPAIISSVIVIAMGSSIGNIQGRFLSPNDDRAAVEKWVSVFRLTLQNSITAIRKRPKPGAIIMPPGRA